MEETITRNEFWKREYRNRRYLQHIPYEELNQRAKDIINNNTFLTDKGQIGFGRNRQQSLFWLPLFTHVLEEMSLRGTGLSGTISENEMIRPTYPENPKGFLKMAKMGLSPGKHLLKFGKREHLEAMFEKGKIRVSPASFYLDPSLNLALRDDELSVVAETSTDLLSRDLLGKHFRVFSKFIPKRGIAFSKGALSDYYVFCLCNKLDHRLFDDFEADACLVIDFPRTFKRKINSAMRVLFPEFVALDSSVKYFDPFNIRPSELNAYFGKHFRFTYQNEYRLIWVPNKKIKNLGDPIFLNLGPLHNLARLVKI